MSEHKYYEAYSKGYKDGQKDQCLADTVDDAMYQLNKLGNVTNGDVIKAMFPYARIEHGLYGMTGIPLICLSLNTRYDVHEMSFVEDWWNAPYMKEVEEWI